jgi:hypothetical protein
MNKSEHRVAIFNFEPDDYHGAPCLGEVLYLDDTDFEGELPQTRTEDEIYAKWMDAGYNAWHMGDDGWENPRQAFEEYGDMPMYYDTFFLVCENPDKILEIIGEILGDKSEYGANALDSDDVIEAILEEDPNALCFVLY